MFIGAHLAGRRRIRARRTAGYTNKDQKQWSQEALYAEGYYLEAAAEITAEPLHTQLRIPALRLKTANASYCQLPEELRTSTLAFMDTSEALLANAAESYDKAITAAGFSTEETHRMRSATKAVLPRTFRLIGPQLDSRAAKAGAIQMQEAEGLLHQFGQSLATLEGSLMGLVKMEAPHQPLALSSLLQLLTSEQVSLATSNHPVIKTLYQLELEDKAEQQGNAPQGMGILGRRRARQADGRGRIGNLVQAMGPGGGRLERERVGSPPRQGLLGGGLLANRPRPIRGLIGGATGALGMNNQPDDRVLAREIAQEICMADLIEFQRLTEQFEEIREWLLT